MSCKRDGEGFEMTATKNDVTIPMTMTRQPRLSYIIHGHSLSDFETL